MSVERKLVGVLMGNLVSQKLNGVADQIKNKIDDMDLSDEEKVQAAKLALDVMKEETNNFFVTAELRLNGIQVGRVKVLPSQSNASL